MRRKLEFLIYAAVILYSIIRYADVDIEAPRRPTPGVLPPVQDAPVLIPDDSPLPRDRGQQVVVELDREVKNGVGTAFAVDAGGTYVTARHVVDGCGEVFLVTGPRKLEKVSSAMSARTRDFAILKASKLRADPFALTDERPRRGDDGFMMGFPQGNPADVRATVIGTTEMRSSGRYSMREPVIAWVERERRPTFKGALGGISGGPVFSAAGYVVGTVVAGAPRRGRVYTTHPKVFREAGVMTSGGRPINGIGRADFEKIGTSLRARHAIAQVYCKAG